MDSPDYAESWPERVFFWAAPRAPQLVALGLLLSSAIQLTRVGALNAGWFGNRPAAWVALACWLPALWWVPRQGWRRAEFLLAVSPLLALAILFLRQPWVGASTVVVPLACAVGGLSVARFRFGRWIGAVLGLVACVPALWQAWLGDVAAATLPMVRQLYEDRQALCAAPPDPNCRPSVHLCADHIELSCAPGGPNVQVWRRRIRVWVIGPDGSVIATPRRVATDPV